MNGCKIKTFVKEHKMEVIAGIGIVCGAIVCVVAGKSLHLQKDKPLKTVNKIRDINIPKNFAVGEVTDLFEDGEEIVAIARNLTVNDLGRFGEELIKHGLAENGSEAAVMTEFLKEL